MTCFLSFVLTWISEIPNTSNSGQLSLSASSQSFALPIYVPHPETHSPLSPLCHATTSLSPLGVLQSRSRGLKQDSQATLLWLFLFHAYQILFSVRSRLYLRYFRQSTFLPALPPFHTSQPVTTSTASLSVSSGPAFNSLPHALAWSPETTPGIVYAVAGQPLRSSVAYLWNLSKFRETRGRTHICCI